MTGFTTPSSSSLSKRNKIVFHSSSNFTIDKEKSLLRVNEEFFLKLNVRMIACGKNHSFLLTQEGILYGLGSNENAKLGVGRAFHELNFAQTPVKVDTLSNIGSVALGDEHSVAVTRDFKVYGWG